MSFIHQELAFVPGMTVIQNIMLGLPKASRFGLVDWRAIAREVAPVAARVGITAPLFASVKGLSTAENWLINICRALVRKARLIVMDEPTASLSAGEGEKLFASSRTCPRSGVAILYVSHRLDEVLRLCHRVTAFRDGRSVAEIARADLTRAALVEAIVGRAVERIAKPATAPPAGDVALGVRGLARHPRVQGVSFDLRRGEVLGIGGLVGAGRTELARLIYGADRTDAGTHGARRQALRAPLAGRGRQGGPRPRAGGASRRGPAADQERRLQPAAREPRAGSCTAPPCRSSTAAVAARSSQSVIRDLAIKTPGIETPVGRLSGGNQQKVVIGRWLLRGPKVLILDEPTRGVDIGARGEIHRLIRDLAAQGHGRARHLVGARRTARPLRPRAGHGGRAHRARTRAGTAPDAQRHHRGELRRTGPRRSRRMTEAVASNRRLSPRTKAGLGLFARYATILGLLAMIAAFAVLSPRAFPTVNNFTNVLNQASLAMIIAAGLTLAVVVGELDLSIGFAASLHGILVTGLIVSNKLPIPLAVLIVLAAGALIGLVNGLIVTKVRVNSVIATLGVGTILTGLAFAYSAGVPIVAGVPEAFLQLSLGRWLYGIPNNIVVMALVVGGLWVLVERRRSARRSRRSAAIPRRRGSRASTSTASRSSAS